jgi:ATP-dependent helicase/nuclease subunit B
LIRLPTELRKVVKQGGTVVVPSRQRAHAARLAHAAAELAAGRRVWATPDILPVEAWLTREVERYAAAAGTAVPRLLSPAEEWFLWRQCAAEATGDLELVNRGALAEALRRASAIAADFQINVRAGGGAAIGASGADGLNRVDVSSAGTELLIEADRGLEPGVSPRSLSESVMSDVPGTEAALLAEVQRAVDERCQSLGATTVASLVSSLGANLRLGGGVPQVVASGFLTIPPRLKPLVNPPSETGTEAAVVPTAIIASDELDELERIAEWCKRRVDENPEARILISLPGAPGTRERLATLIRQAVSPSEWFEGGVDGTPASDANASRRARKTPAVRDASAAREAAVARGPTDNLVVIEGGVPLARVPAVAHALETLSWLGGNSGDFEAVSGWLRSPYWQTPGALHRARLDLWLRERERMHFDLHELVAALSGAPAALASIAREVSAQINKAAVALGQGSASPRDWSERFKAALEEFDWPGERARGSGEQQTVVRFYELLDEFGQLASAARSISRDNAIQWFTELATRTAFRPADDDAVITISSVLAAPVVRYGAIWIAGLHAEAFPQPVQPDPFIPLAAQLAAGVPAASASGRLAEARALVGSWRECADELVLSAPARSEDLELLPSPLLAEWLPGEPVVSSAPQRLPAELHQPATQGTRAAGLQGRQSLQGLQGLQGGQDSADAGPPTSSLTVTPGSIWLAVRVHREGLLETFDDPIGPVWPIDQPLPSGTRSLELQNQCPFRAYAELRLGSTPLDGPEPGIAADLRGQLLHAALQKLWERLHDSHGLAALSEVALDAAIHRCVEEAADETTSRSPSQKPRVAAPNDTQGDLFGEPHRSPALTRECRRAMRLIHALCAVERERAPFRVESTELDSKLTLQGAELRIRIDRVDALESGGRAILDYKSGRRTTADWYGERPSHPQLLAYLAALGDDVVAMATVNVTAREVRFDGIANSAELLPKVKRVEGAFGTDPLDAWPTRRAEWLSRIEHLAADFIAGRAVVDPKPGACDYCHVASICRISDRVETSDVSDASDDADRGAFAGGGRE